MSSTKTFTVGKESIKDLINILNEYIDSNKNIEFSSNKIHKADTFISLLKMTPWNEGGYCQDEL